MESQHVTRLGQPSVSSPPQEGATWLMGAPIDLSAFGYIEEELFFDGEARSFVPDGLLGEDGSWQVQPGESEAYRSRLVVRRPSVHSEFNGTVWVEWLNVSGGLDVPVMFNFAGIEILRTGAAWVGVTAQRVGIDGVGAVYSESRGAGPIDLKAVQPKRYAELHHPGDDWSFDIFGQAGAAVRRDPAVLGGLEPQRVFAMGESQSAHWLTTFVNVFAPTETVFDGYLLHGRSGGAAPLVASEQGPPVEGRGLRMPGPDTARTRTDLEVPVFAVEAETDVVADGLGFVRARQPDTDRIRCWEMAGTAHSDLYLLDGSSVEDGKGAADELMFEGLRHPPTSLVGGIITLAEPINAGPQTYILRAALRRLDEWVREGRAPSSQPPLELNDDASDVLRDLDGASTGGVRTPHVDAPIAALKGIGQPPGAGVLNGTTLPFDADTLRRRYGDEATFVRRWNDACVAAVESGVLCPEDAERLTELAAAFRFDPGE